MVAQIVHIVQKGHERELKWSQGGLRKNPSFGWLQIGRSAVMIEIKDLAGLSKPLKRLVEVVAEGIGAVSRPSLVRKNADAKAYEIRAVAQAISDSQKLLGPVTYEAGTISISSSSVHTEPILSDQERVMNRIGYQEAKRQAAIDNITVNAAEELANVETIASEKPDSDWTARFFRIAEDITTEKMQLLWGKVLAGEIKQPGSYSLRTLDALKNITQGEAELFVRVARIAFRRGEMWFVPKIDRGQYLADKFQLPFNAFLKLREIGLIVESDLVLKFAAATEDKQDWFAVGNNALIVNRPRGAPQQTIAVIAFTQIGKQLLELVDRTFVEPDFIERFAGLFLRPGVVIEIGDIVKWHGDSTLEYENVRTLFNERPVLSDGGENETPLSAELGDAK